MRLLIKMTSDMVSVDVLVVVKVCREVDCGLPPWQNKELKIFLEACDDVVQHEMALMSDCPKRGGRDLKPGRPGLLFLM